MKRWLVRLYPRAWRRRYGAEFTALLEQQPFTLTGILDVVRGALDAHRIASPATGQSHARMQRSALSRFRTGMARVDRKERPMKRGATSRSCSFCGKSQEQVQRLIAGPAGVYICQECVALCNDIIADADKRPPEGQPCRTATRPWWLHVVSSPMRMVRGRRRVRFSVRSASGPAR